MKITFWILLFLGLDTLLFTPALSFAKQKGQGSVDLSSAHADTDAAAKYSQSLEQGCAGDATTGAQRQEHCLGATANDNAAAMNGNNSKVWSSISVVCLGTCMYRTAGLEGEGQICQQGIPSSHAPISGVDPCDSSVRSAWYAFQTNRASIESRRYSAANFLQSATLASKAVSAEAGGAPSFALNSAKNVAKLSPACKSAKDTGNAQARIDCATEIDPNLPKFIKSEQFAAELQRLTGQTLESFMNLSADEMIQIMGPTVLNHLQEELKDQLSPQVLTAQSRAMLGQLVGSLPPAEAGWLASKLPAPFSGMEPFATLLVQTVQGAGVVSQVVQAVLGNGGVRAPSAVVALPVEIGGSKDMGLFQRVSLRYTSVKWRLESLGYSSPSNQESNRLRSK